MWAPLFTSTMKKKARGYNHHFHNEGKGEGFRTSPFQKEVNDGGSALHFHNEGTGARFRTSLFQGRSGRWGRSTFSMKEKARGWTQHFLNEGEGEAFRSSLSH